MNIKEARLKAKMTQAEAAELVQIPLRTYARYESDYSGASKIKKDYILKTLLDYSEITEEKGILDIEEIRRICEEICTSNDIPYCYLFGSYVKKNATGKSDVDLLVNTDISGLRFYALVDEFRRKLHKKVDLLRVEDVIENKELLNDILKEGIRIYG